MTHRPRHAQERRGGGGKVKGGDRTSCVSAMVVVAQAQSVLNTQKQSHMTVRVCFSLMVYPPSVRADKKVVFGDEENGYVGDDDTGRDNKVLAD